MNGTVYLLHFEPGLHITGNRYARHYLGWTQCIDDRIEQHLKGRGSKLIKAAIAAGSKVELVRTWKDVDRHFERRLKNRKAAPRMCPVCLDCKEAA